MSGIGDDAILAALRAAFERSDPPPADLDERVLFALALEDIDIEVARLQSETLAGSSARGTELSKTITFDSESVTVMISIVDRPDGLARIDGWLAPAGVARVELRLGTPDSIVVRADDGGRFVFEAVARGLAQLIVHTDERTIVTPALTI